MPDQITIITTTADLAEFCSRAAKAPFVTVDTEFLRERTYYSKLCLVQLAFPGDGETDAVLVDPLSEDLSLDPLLELFRDTSVVKVFHAARQDLEIFQIDTETLPQPLFDTQVAAMVCGFGDQVAYETLCRRLAGTKLDKSSRFTDWSRRPLSKAQQAYALGDVTHLRTIYLKLSEQLDKSGRAAWLSEEMASLQDPSSYRIKPEDAWQRIKTRTTSGAFLAVLRELAAFRETLAQSRNVPRNRIMKDDALTELASTKPQTLADLGAARLLQREARKGEVAEGLLEAIKRGLNADAPRRRENPREGLMVNPALADLLRVLLKAKSENLGIAQKLLASAVELDQIAAGQRDLAPLKGWRFEAFGRDAVALCNGEIALGANGGAVEVIELEDEDPVA